MALVPILHDLDTWDFDRRLNRFWDWKDFDSFGSAMTPGEIRALMDFPRYLRRFGSLSDLELPTLGKDGLQVSINVHQFKPHEITVKTAGDYVIIEGKHKERPDGHGYISRHFLRRYLLPKGYEPKDVISTLSSDGILTVKAPPPYKPISYSKERFVPIKHTISTENRLKSAKI